jgi:phosphoglycolate phosphatase
MLNLIWDLDGTLIDSQQEVMHALHLAIHDAQLNENDIITPLRVGPTIDDILKTSFSEKTLTKNKLTSTIAAFRKRYDNSAFDKTIAFNGIDNIIKNKEKFTHYIITNKPDIPSNKIIDKLGWKPYICQLITPYTFNKTKQKKEELFKNLVSSRHFNIDTTYGIGDMSDDCNAAKYSGIHTIGVLWGTGTKKELMPCEYTCSTVRELAALLESLCIK